MDPAAGLRIITARVRRDAATPVNRKKIHRILKLNQWQVRQRPHGHRPRVQGWASRATRPNDAAGNARVQLAEVNFEAVDWARAVRVLRW